MENWNLIPIGLQKHQNAETAVARGVQSQKPPRREMFEKTAVKNILDQEGARGDADKLALSDYSSSERPITDSKAN